MTLKLEELPDCWRVTVDDDGVGFDLEAAHSQGSIALENVRRRMDRFPGCELRIASFPGVGTKVILIYGKQEKSEEP